MKQLSPSDLEEGTEGFRVASPFDWTIDIMDDPCIARIGGISPVESDLAACEKRDGLDRKRVWKNGRSPLRRKKKPKGMPKRPLSAYNIFFQIERSKIVEENNKEMDYHSSVAKLTFEELGKIIGRRWKALKDEDRKHFDKLADEEGSRYRKEIEAYNTEKRRKRAERADQLERPFGLGLSVPSVESDKAPQTPRPQEEEIDVPPPLSSFPLEASTPVKARLPSNHLERSPTKIASLHAPILDASLPPRPVAPFSHQPRGAWLPPRTLYQVPLRVDAPPEPISSCTSYLPVPPGMELFLPDASGQDRKYFVKYNFYKMSRREAEEYMQSLESSARADPASSSTPTDFAASSPSTGLQRLQPTSSSPPYSTILRSTPPPPSTDTHRPTLQWNTTV